MACVVLVTNEQHLTRRQRRQQQQARNDMAKVLAEPAGRRVLMRLIDATGVFAHIPTGEMAERVIGRREVGLGLVEQIEQAAPGTFANLQLEAVRSRQEDSTSQPEEEPDVD
jgi:hypothetical protein